MLPTNRTVFKQAKIVFAMDGAAEVETAYGTRRLDQGTVLTIGGGRWCRVRPLPIVRTWTLYVDETFLRAQMSWLLPDKERVRAGVHPHEWDGSPLVLHPGVSALTTIEPLWRRMSVLNINAHTPETVAARTVELFTRAVEAALPILLLPEHDGGSVGPPILRPIHGRLTEASMAGHVG